MTKQREAMLRKEGHIGDVMALLCPHKVETVGYVKMWRALRRVNGETLGLMAAVARPIEATGKLRRYRGVMPGWPGSEHGPQLIKD